MTDPRDSRIVTDEWGEQWLIGENGELLKDEFGKNIPPMKSNIISSPNEFTVYDSSKGHCPLCGRLTCRGECFK